MNTPTCLTMIVKNEAAVLERAIASVRGLVDSYAIVDTGSTDGTREIARRALEGLPGQIVEAPWEGYGPARCRALDIAEAATWGKGYALIVDADDIWSADARPELTHDAHSVWFENAKARWSTARFLRLGCGIRYEGVVHEQPVKDGRPVEAPLLEGVTLSSPNDGATWADPKKYLVHAKAIAAAMVDEPGNTRYAFYLAQSYRDYGDDETAARLYLARGAMGAGTHAEEVYIAYLEAGRALWRLGRLDSAQRALLNAHNAYPARREAMAELARLFAIKAATMPTVGTLFVEKSPCLEDE